MLERNRTEEERYKLAAIVQNCFDFIGISTLAGKAMFVNSAGRRMVGLRDDEPIPREISSYVADEAQEQLKESLQVVEREGFWDGQTTFRHFPGGADLPVLQHIFYIREPNTGRRLALATVCRDISQRRRTELTLSKAQQELAHASRVLSIGELTASLAHEINQPLAAIVTNANAARRWLEQTVPNYKRAKLSLESIVRDGNRASAIIRRVRSFSAKHAVPIRTGHQRSHPGGGSVRYPRDLARACGTDDPARGAASHRDRGSRRVATGCIEPGYQQYRGIASGRRAPETAADYVRAPEQGHAGGVRAGQWDRHRAATSRAHVRRVLHDQIQRHGTRPGHQPSDRRVLRWDAAG